MTRKKVMAKHWSDEVSQCDIAALHEIKTGIEQHLINAATSFVEIGHMLNRARVLIPGDLEFGQWREQFTPFTAKQANNYMKVATKFSKHTLVAKTSLSVLVELSSAPPELTEKVEKQIDEGKPVKRADVQAEKKKIRDAEQKSKQEAKDANTMEEIAPVVDKPSPPPEEDSLPDGDFEMIAVTEDEFDLVIAALDAYGSEEATALADRLNK